MSLIDNKTQTDIVFKVKKESQSGLFNNDRLLMLKSGYISYFSRQPKGFVGTVRSLQMSGELPKYTLSVSDVKNSKIINGTEIQLDFEEKLIDRNSLSTMIDIGGDVGNIGNHKQQNQIKKWHFVCQSKSQAQYFSNQVNAYLKSPSFKPSLDQLIGGYRSAKKGYRPVSLLPTTLVDSNKYAKKRLSEIPTLSSNQLESNWKTNHQKVQNLSQDVLIEINKRRNMQIVVSTVQEKDEESQQDEIEVKSPIKNALLNGNDGNDIAIKSKNQSEIGSKTHQDAKIINSQGDHSTKIKQTAQILSKIPSESLKKETEPENIDWNKKTQENKIDQPKDKQNSQKIVNAIEKGQLQSNLDRIVPLDYNQTQPVLESSQQTIVQLIQKPYTVSSVKELSLFEKRKMMFEGNQQQELNRNQSTAYISRGHQPLKNDISSRSLGKKVQPNQNQRLLEQTSMFKNQLKGQFIEETRKQTNKINSISEKLTYTKIDQNPKVDYQKAQDTYSSSKVNLKPQTNSQSISKEASNILSRSKEPQIYLISKYQEAGINSKSQKQDLQAGKQLLGVLKTVQIISSDRQIQSLYPIALKQSKSAQYQNQRKLEINSNLTRIKELSIQPCQNSGITQRIINPNYSEVTVSQDSNRRREVSFGDGEVSLGELQTVAKGRFAEKKTGMVVRVDESNDSYENSQEKFQQMTPRFHRLSYPSQAQIEGLVFNWKTHIPPIISKELNDIKEINIIKQQCLDAFIEEIESRQSQSQMKVQNIDLFNPRVLSTTQCDMRIKEYMLDENQSEYYYAFSMYRALSKKIQKSRKMATKINIAKVLYLRYKNYQGIAIQKQSNKKLQNIEQLKLLCQQLKYFLKTLEEDIPGLTLSMLKVDTIPGNKFVFYIDQSRMPIIKIIVDIPTMTMEAQGQQSYRVLSSQAKLQAKHLLKSDKTLLSLKNQTHASLNKFLFSLKPKRLNSRALSEYISTLRQPQNNKNRIGIGLQKYIISETLGCVYQDQKWVFQGHAMFAGMVGKMIEQSYDKFNRCLLNLKICESKSVLYWQIQKIRVQKNLNHLDDYIEVCIRVCEVVMAEQMFETTVFLCERLLKTVPDYHIERVRIYAILLNAYHRLQKDSQTQAAFSNAVQQVSNIFGQKSVVLISIYRAYAFHLSQTSTNFSKAQQLYLQCLQLSQQHTGFIYIDLVDLYINNKDVQSASIYAKKAYATFKGTPRQSEAVLCLIKTGQLNDASSALRCLRVYCERGQVDRIVDCYRVFVSVFQMESHDNLFWNNQQQKVSEVFEQLRKAHNICGSQVLQGFILDSIRNLPNSIQKIARMAFQNQSVQR